MSMSSVGSAGAVALAVLFAFAAVAKLRARPATVRSFTALGLPAPATMAVLVPALEMLIALVLVLDAPAGSVAALVTLAFFTAFVAKRLSEGSTVPCACFGASSNQPLSPFDLARNVGLLALGALALAAPEPLDLAVLGTVLVFGGTGLVAFALHQVRPGGPR
jgi:hypothetical protein